MILNKSSLFVLLCILLYSCQKEITGEIITKASVGSLQKDGAGNCLGSNVSGVYQSGTALNSGNYAEVTVSVDSSGTYVIETDAVNGYSFKASGKFTAKGIQVVKLQGSGKPLIKGTNNFTVKYNGTVCQFSVAVTDPPGGTSVYSINCSTAVLNGSYAVGIAMTSSNTVKLDVNVTTIGTWNVSSTTTNGITFTGSGNFTSTGAQSITLTATGTPTASGNVNIPVNNGSSTCSFPLTINAAPSIDWKFTEGANTYQGSTSDAQLTTVASFATFTYSGDNSTDHLILAIVDLAGGINANETYSSANTSGNSGGIGFVGGSEMYTADNTTTSVNFTIKVTSHNTSAKTIQGTFSGTVLNSANAIRTITNGQFQGTYH